MRAGRAPGRELAVVALLAVAAVIVWLLVRTYPNYDAYYHLVWGRELLDGHKPTFEAYQAPTQHPLYLVVAAVLAALAGGEADRWLVLLSALSLVGLVWAVFRVGRAVFGTWPGLVAALLTGSSIALLLYAARAYVDVPFLALVMWAAVLEAERPRRGTPVMVLLTLAGLLRPEAWVLAGAYWIWCVWPLRGGAPSEARRRNLRPRLLALALLAPALWALVDFWVTGDALHSLNATSDLADELGRRRGIGEVPGALVKFMADTLRVPVLLAALAGIALAWRRREGRSLHVPIALLASGIVTFVASGAAGLSILPRYLTVPAIALAIFAGYALAGWSALPGASPLRRRWSMVVVAMAVVGVAFVVGRLSVVERFTNELRFVTGVHDDLVAALESPAVAAGRRCGPVTLPNYRLVPDARWILDAPREDVGARSARRRAAGVALVYADRKTLRRYGFADGASPSTNAPDPGFVRASRHGRVTVYVACPAQP